MYVAIIKFF